MGQIGGFQVVKKTEQHKFGSKILTFDQFQHKSQLSWNWAICAISESQMKERAPKLECKRKTEQDKSFLKILTFG